MLVGDSLPLIGHQLALVSQTLTLIGQRLALIRDPLALAGDHLPLGRDPLALLSRPNDGSHPGPFRPGPPGARPTPG